MPRTYVRKTAGPAYSKADLANAVLDVQNHNKTFREAQAHYHVPIAVISQRINGRKTSLDTTGRGRHPALSREIEDKIANSLVARAKMGYPCDKEELLNLVEEYITSNNIKTPFVNNRPGSDWYYAFMKRHENLSVKKPEHLQKCRKDARRPDIIYDFFQKLKSTIDTLGLQNPEMACFIFNADESGFRSDPSRIRAIGQKGKALSRISGGSGRESTTVLACISADGTALPPMIVFKGAAIQARWISEKAYRGTLYAVSKNGWMEEPQFSNWFKNGFIPHVENVRLQKKLPNQAAVLLYDGHASHISVCIVEEAINHNITLIKLPSHLTDKLQPLDKCVFGPVKTCWEKKLIAHGKKKMGEGSGRLTKQEFVELLGVVWTEAMRCENIISGFSSSGIYPVDSTKFPQSEFTETDLEAYNLAQRRSTTNNDVITLTSVTNQQENLIAQPGPSGIQRIPQHEDVISHPGPSSENAVQANYQVHKPADLSLQSLGNLDIEKVFFKQCEKEKKTSIESETKEKKVIARLKQRAYGEVLTTNEVLNRLKEAEEAKALKGRGKAKNKIVGTENKEKRPLKRKTVDDKQKSIKKKMPSLSQEVETSSEEGDVEFDSSGLSSFEENDENVIEITSANIKNLNNGDFVLAEFKGGKRHATFYKYVCVIENVESDVSESEIEVTGLKRADDTYMNFAVDEKDVSFIKNEQIIGLLPFPTLKMKGERIYYHFAKRVPVAEK